jgi:hypothetical protein
MNNDRFVSYTLFTKRDWFCSSFRFRFYHLTCLKFNVKLFFCVIFLRFFFSSFNYFSFIDCRFDHCEIIISHYFFSLTITIRWSWNDRRREKKNYEKERHRLNCVVLRVRLWIEKNESRENSESCDRISI